MGQIDSLIGGVRRMDERLPTVVNIELDARIRTQMAQSHACSKARKLEAENLKLEGATRSTLWRETDSYEGIKY
jgi:hypothetical protein